MHPRRIFGNAFLIGLASLSVTACSSDPQEKYVAELRSSNEVPTNSSSASGRVVLLVSRDASYAEYSVEQGGLTGGIRGGHFHRAAAGVECPRPPGQHIPRARCGGARRADREGETRERAAIQPRGGGDLRMRQRGRRRNLLHAIAQIQNGDVVRVLRRLRVGGIENQLEDYLCRAKFNAFRIILFAAPVSWKVAHFRNQH